MKLHLRIAFRYIFAKRTFNFISFITALSIVGITVGVAALIAVMSIFKGFQEITRNQLIGFDPHLQILPARGVRLSDYESILKKAAADPEVEIAAPVVSGRIVSTRRNSFRALELTGLPREAAPAYLEAIYPQVVTGAKSFTKDNEILIGALLADKLLALPNDTLLFLSPKSIEAALVQLAPLPASSARVSGIFQTNVREFDEGEAFSPIEFARSALRIPQGEITAINIRIKDINDLESVQSRIASILPANMQVKSWKDLNADLYRVMQFERMAAFSILSLIIIIAVFNLLASLAMTVTEKRRDIGLLRALGADPRLISRTFLSEGLIIGSAGTLFGAILGVGASLGQIHYKWFKIDTSRYIIDAIPVSLSAQDVMIVCAVSLALSFLATIYPSRKAAKTQVIEAMRSE